MSLRTTLTAAIAEDAAVVFDVELDARYRSFGTKVIDEMAAAVRERILALLERGDTVLFFAPTMWSVWRVLEHLPEKYRPSPTMPKMGQLATATFGQNNAIRGKTADHVVAFCNVGTTGYDKFFHSMFLPIVPVAKSVLVVGANLCAPMDRTHSFHFTPASLHTEQS